MYMLEAAGGEPKLIVSPASAVTLLTVNEFFAAAQACG